MNDKEIIEELSDKPLPEPYEIDGYKFAVTPCIKSGFCCTTAPCQYGEWNDNKSACKYLLPANELGQKYCGHFDWIKANVPNWKIYPAFGAGCCSALGNNFRQDIIKKFKEKT